MRLDFLLNQLHTKFLPILVFLYGNSYRGNKYAIAIRNSYTEKRKDG